jgi:hypothetical protein
MQQIWNKKKVKTYEQIIDMQRGAAGPANGKHEQTEQSAHSVRGRLRRAINVKFRDFISMKVPLQERLMTGWCWWMIAWSRLHCLNHQLWSIFCKSLMRCSTCTRVQREGAGGIRAAWEVAHRGGQATALAKAG